MSLILWGDNKWLLIGFMSILILKMKSLMHRVITFLEVMESMSIICEIFWVSQINNIMKKKRPVLTPPTPHTQLNDNKKAQRRYDKQRQYVPIIGIFIQRKNL